MKANITEELRVAKEALTCIAEDLKRFDVEIEDINARDCGEQVLRIDIVEARKLFHALKDLNARKQND